MLWTTDDDVGDGSFPDELGSCLIENARLDLRCFLAYFPRSRTVLLLKLCVCIIVHPSALIVWYLFRWYKWYRRFGQCRWATWERRDRSPWPAHFDYCSSWCVQCYTQSFNTPGIPTSFGTALWFPSVFIQMKLGYDGCLLEHLFLRCKGAPASNLISFYTLI